MADPAPGGRSNLRSAGQGDVGGRVRLQALSGQVRQRAGFVATFANERGETLSAHRSHAASALPLLLAEVDALAGDWRLQAYSTPDGILIDVAGARDHSDRSKFPEAVVLGHCGRKDLLHPRLGGPPWR